MEKTLEYYPKGVCSVKMVLTIEDSTDTIVDFHVVGGCNGNLSGIRQLIIGMNAKDVREKLSGVICGHKSTSCPDQLSKAIGEYFLNKKA